MFRNANNNFFAFVCNNAAITAKANGTLISAASDLADGEVVLVNKDSEALNPAAALTGNAQFKIVTRAGGKLFNSPLINFADCTISAGLATNAVNQVTTIGSNGTTSVTLEPSVGVADDGAALAAIGTSYYILIEKQDNDEANRQGYAPSITAQAKWTNPNGFTNAEYMHLYLAELLRESLRKNDQLEASTPATKGPKYLRAEALVVDNTLKTTVGAVTLTLTHGSTTITSSGNVAAFAIGDYVILGEDVYRITSVGGGTSFTIEFPYAGPSGTMAGGTTATTAGYLTFANIGNLTGVGLRLTAQSQHTFDVNRDRKWSVSRFNVRFAKNGAGVGAVITTGTAPSEGLGNWQQVAMEEYESFGALGQRWVSDIPAALRDQNTVTDGSRIYGLISLREVTTKQNSLIGSTIGKTTYHIWLELDGNDASTNQLETTGDTQDALLIILGVTDTDVATSGQV